MLIKKPFHSIDNDDQQYQRKEIYDITKIPRITNIPHDFIYETSYSSRQEASIYFIKLSRSSIPQG